MWTTAAPRGFGRLILLHAPPAPDQAQGGLQPRPASASLGQPRPIGRYALAGRPHRPCLPHRCSVSLVFFDLTLTLTLTLTRCSVSLIFFDAALETMPWLEPPAPLSAPFSAPKVGDRGSGDKGGDRGSEKVGDKGGDKGGDRGGVKGAPAGMGWVEPEARRSTSSEGASEAMAAGLAHLLATELPAVAAEIDMEGLATAQVSRQ